MLFFIVSPAKSGLPLVGTGSPPDRRVPPSAEAFAMALNGAGDALHAGFEDAARHGEVEAHIALGVADEKAVSALECGRREAAEGNSRET